MADRPHADVAAELGMSDGALRQLLLRARTTLRAAATALTPYPLVMWLAGGQEATAARVAEVAVGAGGAGVAIKAGVAVLAAGAVVAGAPALRDEHAPMRAMAAPASTQAHRPAAARPAAAVTTPTATVDHLSRDQRSGSGAADGHGSKGSSSGQSGSGHEKGTSSHRSGSSGPGSGGSDSGGSESPDDDSGSSGSGSAGSSDSSGKGSSGEEDSGKSGSGTELEAQAVPVVHGEDTPGSEPEHTIASSSDVPSDRTLLLLAATCAAALVFPAAGMARSHGDGNGDRIPDRWERAHHLSLTVNQAKRDQDHDGLRNRAEWMAGDNPRDADTDDDGNDDGDEGAGTVTSFAGGVLTIHLFNGDDVKGTVDDMTEIECEHRDTGSTTARAASDGPGDHDHGEDGHHGDGHHGDGHHGDGHHGDGHHGDDDHGDQAGCDASLLTAGRVVHEAELKATSSGLAFREIELVS